MAVTETTRGAGCATSTRTCDATFPPGVDLNFSGGFSTLNGARCRSRCADGAQASVTPSSRQPEALERKSSSDSRQSDTNAPRYPGYSRKGDSQKFTLGSVLFGALLFVAGALPSSLPYLYLVFVAICLPARIVSFCRQRWTFFLIDFCYFANVAVCLFLLFAPENFRLQTAVYALADGPLAGALAVWQCALVFGSSSHYISVMIHLFPGLAVFAHKWSGGPKTPAAVRACLARTYTLLRQHQPLTSALQCWEQPPTAPPTPPEATTLVWTFAAPLLFYGVWQFIYWAVVQVCCRRFILRNGYETSYITLARRASKADNFWNQLVRRGSASRRVVMYGLLQLAFTLITLTAFQVVHGSFYFAFLWQVAKFVIPVWYGSKVQCEKVPQRAVHQALSLHDLDSMVRDRFAAAFDKRS